MQYSLDPSYPSNRNPSIGLGILSDGLLYKWHLLYLLKSQMAPRWQRIGCRSLITRSCSPLYGKRCYRHSPTPNAPIFSSSGFPSAAKEILTLVIEWSHRSYQFSLAYSSLDPWTKYHYSWISNGAPRVEFRIKDGAVAIAQLTGVVFRSGSTSLPSPSHSTTCFPLFLSVYVWVSKRISTTLDWASSEFWSNSRKTASSQNFN